MTEAAESVGVGRTTVVSHIANDPTFARAVNASKLGIADCLVGVAIDNAKSPEGVRDRWSLIERLNPTEFGKVEQSPTEITITIDGNKLTSSLAQANALEAEVVQQYTQDVRHDVYTPVTTQVTHDSTEGDATPHA